MRTSGLFAVTLLVACSTGARPTLDEPVLPVSPARDAGVHPSETRDAGEAQDMSRATPMMMERDAGPSRPSEPSDDDATTANDASTGDAEPVKPPGEDAAPANDDPPGMKPTMNPLPEAPEDTPVEPDPSECEYIELRARADESGAPFRVSANAIEQYQCFVFDQKFDAPTQALAIYPIFDNRSVVHHWLLYATDGDVDVSKNTVPCGAFQEDSALLAGGGPGGPPWFLPKHVGLDIGTGKFIMEVHYNNVSQKDTTDRSGTRLCTTKKLRPETAVVHWLGNQLFSIPARATNFEVAGRCKPPQIQRPIHLLRSWPHMHKLGKRMTLELDRADGTRTTVFDVAFSFDAQQNADARAVLQPGDSLLTTCYYDNTTDFPVTVGNNTTDEMCNNFVVAYPAGALTTNFLSLTKNSCLGLP